MSGRRQEANMRRNSHRAAGSVRAAQQCYCYCVLLYPTAAHHKTTGAPYLIDHRHNTAYACSWSSRGLNSHDVLFCCAYTSHDTTRCGVSHPLLFFVFFSACIIRVCVDRIRDQTCCTPVLACTSYSWAAKAVVIGLGRWVTRLGSYASSLVYVCMYMRSTQLPRGQQDASCGPQPLLNDAAGIALP